MCVEFGFWEFRGFFPVFFSGGFFYLFETESYIALS